MTAEWSGFIRSRAEEQATAERNRHNGNGIGLSEFTEDALALRFTAKHAGELRYVAPWGSWLRWHGGKWNFERTLFAYDLARQVAREAYADCLRPGIASARTASAIEKLAQADRRHAATVEQ